MSEFGQYWGSVAKRAAKEAAKDVRLDSPAAIITVIATQTVVAVGLFLALGKWTDTNVWTRVMSAAVPFILYPIAILVRMASVPVSIDTALRSELEPEATDISLTVDGGVAIIWNDGDPTETTKCGFLAHVRNVGAVTLRNCQLMWISHPPMGYPQETPLSDPFDLKPKQARWFPTVHVEDGAKSSGNAYVIPMDSSPIVGIGVPAGEYELRVLADDNHGASIRVVLNEDDDLSKPASRRWSLKPAA